METTRQSFLKEHPAITGLLLVLVTFALTAWLPHAWALETFAALLSLIGAVYVGFAVAQGRQMFLQFGVALGFMLAGLLGLWLSPWLLVAGYVAHGFWDWLHHPHDLASARKKPVELERSRWKRQSVKLTDWYAPFCLVYDWGVALLIVVWWIL